MLVDGSSVRSDLIPVEKTVRGVGELVVFVVRRKREGEKGRRFWKLGMRAGRCAGHAEIGGNRFPIVGHLPIVICPGGRIEESTRQAGLGRDVILRVVRAGLFGWVALVDHALAARQERVPYSLHGSPQERFLTKAQQGRWFVHVH